MKSRPPKATPQAQPKAQPKARPQGRVVPNPEGRGHLGTAPEIYKLLVETDVVNHHTATMGEAEIDQAANSMNTQQAQADEEMERAERVAVANALGEPLPASEEPPPSDQGAGRKRKPKTEARQFADRMKVARHHNERMPMQKADTTDGHKRTWKADGQWVQ